MGMKYFVLTSPEPISEYQAKVHQANMGYMWQGYGFYSFRCIEREDGMFEARWCCGDSCEEFNKGEES